MYQYNILCVLIFVAFANSAMAQDPYIVAPKNYRLEFENESVRVSRATFSPGDKLPVHDHPGFPIVLVYLTDGGPIRFTHVQPQFTVERPAVEASGIRFHSGATETHIVEYLGASLSEYLRIELKTERLDKKRQSIRIKAEDDKPFENSQIRISRSLCAGCGDVGYPAVVVSLKDRSVAWREAGSVGTNDAGLIRVELKTKAATGP